MHTSLPSSPLADKALREEEAKKARRKEAALSKKVPPAPKKNLLPIEKAHPRVQEGRPCIEKRLGVSCDF
jgi:hypothetical protein